VGKLSELCAHFAFFLNPTALKVRLLWIVSGGGEVFVYEPVFLSYSSADKPAIEEISRRLAKKGVSSGNGNFVLEVQRSS